MLFQVLIQARFFVVLHGARVNWCRHTFKHILLGQNLVGRMQFFEGFEVVENLLGDGVNHPIRHLGRGDKGGLYTKGLHVFGVGGTRIEFDRDESLGVVGILLQELVHAGDGDEMDLPPARGGLLDSPTGVTHGVKEGINTAVLEQAGSLSRLDPLCLQVFFVVDTGIGQAINGVLSLTGAGVADVDPFTPEVIDRFDPGIIRGHVLGP